jgi:taurine dioxygenase
MSNEPERSVDVRSNGKFGVRTLSTALGVEVLDLQLDRALDDDEVAALRELFDRYHLLLFREQSLSADDQLRICGHLRPVVDPVAWISNVEAGFHPEGELFYHCDYAFTAHPMLGLSLYAIELGSGAAPTYFANNERACRELDDSLRGAIEELRVVHLIDSVNGRDNIRTRLDDIGGDEASPTLYPRFARPAIWPHPITGAPLLFVLQQQASHFEGWSCRDSDALLDAAFEVLYDDANVYVHHWQVGDFIVWDNLALQHGRPANPNTVRRSLRRVAMNTVTTAQLINGTGFDPAVRAERARSG